MLSNKIDESAGVRVDCLRFFSENCWNSFLNDLGKILIVDWVDQDIHENNLWKDFLGIMNNFTEIIEEIILPARIFNVSKF